MDQQPDKMEQQPDKIEQQPDKIRVPEQGGTPTPRWYHQVVPPLANKA